LPICSRDARLEGERRQAARRLAPARCAGRPAEGVEGRHRSLLDNKAQDRRHITTITHFTSEASETTWGEPPATGQPYGRGPGRGSTARPPPAARRARAGAPGVTPR